MQQHPRNIDELNELLLAPEGTQLEFKEAKRSFDSKMLTQYCVALMNEGGGSIIFGVSDRPPRQVVGTEAFGNLNEHQHKLNQRLRCRVEIDAFNHPNGRVVVVTVPSRPIGIPIEHDGAYWMRQGESLVSMDVQRIRRILDEAQSDFTATTCRQAGLDELSTTAIAKLRGLWAERVRGKGPDTQNEAHLLEDLGLVVDGRVTYAALVLLGSRQALSRHLPCAEVVFEYRGRDGQLGSDERVEYREGLMLSLEPLWELVNKRNTVRSLHVGLFRTEIEVFDERSVREGILNAFCHRDYRNQGSVFLRQTPTTLEVVSPGGFPVGVSSSNVLWKQSPRNRLLADVLLKCGLVERSGQGADLMFDAAIRQGKTLPDYEASDDWSVVLKLDGTVVDGDFVAFLEKIGSASGTLFGIKELLVLDAVHRGTPLPTEFKRELAKLLEVGAIERTGRGRGVRYLLAEQYYRQVNKRAAYSRVRGLDRGTNEALLMAHIVRFRDEGSPLKDLLEVLPSVSRPTVQRLLQSLRKAGRVELRGSTNAARYFPTVPVPVSDEGESSG